MVTFAKLYQNLRGGLRQIKNPGVVAGVYVVLGCAMIGDFPFTNPALARPGKFSIVLFSAHLLIPCLRDRLAFVSWLHPFRLVV
jgi:hypothetical protein